MSLTKNPRKSHAFVEGMTQMVAYWRERSTLALALVAGISLGLLVVLDLYNWI